MLVYETHAAARTHAALAGRYGAVRDRRKRRLAGPVFADERMNFTRVHVEIDAVDRGQVAEAFADAAQQQRGGAYGLSTTRLNCASSSRVAGGVI
ncbi:MAG: hypothetical protein NVS3B28_10490 [Candidatus Velthaea sp.]